MGSYLTDIFSAYKGLIFRPLFTEKWVELQENVLMLRYKIVGRLGIDYGTKIWYI
jgi:hypothetical protein